MSQEQKILRVRCPAHLRSGRMRAGFQFGPGASVFFREGECPQAILDDGELMKSHCTSTEMKSLRGRITEVAHSGDAPELIGTEEAPGEEPSKPSPSKSRKARA